MGIVPNIHAPAATQAAKRWISSSANSGPDAEVREKPRATAEKVIMTPKAEKTKIQASTER
jgi:hypothetical protein